MHDASLTWVIAYGSNLDPLQLKSRVGTVQETLVGSLPGWRFVFGKDAGNGYAYADIVPDSNGNCPAMALLFDQRQLEIMDTFEGVHTGHYLRMQVNFQPRSGEPGFLAQAWVATPEKRMMGSPTPEYLAKIRRGYGACGFDDVLLLKEAV